MVVWVSFGGHEYKVDRIKQTFCPRTRHGELKVISMIYAPPYLIRRSVPKVKSIARTRNVSDDNPRSTQGDKHWKTINGCTLLLRSNTRSRRQHNTTHYGIAPIVESG